jgi:hypothetical protein
MHRLSQAGEETVDVGVSCAVDSYVGMAVLSDLSASDILGVDSPGKFLCTIDQFLFR